jgi:hypothetical protein
MRYAQGGGLTDERRAFREKLRMEAAEPLVRGLDQRPVGAALAQGLVPGRAESFGFQGTGVIAAAQ